MEHTDEYQLYSMQDVDTYTDKVDHLVDHLIDLFGDTENAIHSIDTLLKAIEVRLKKYTNRKNMIAHMTISKEQIDEQHILTKRQISVLSLVIKGLKNKEIAELLSISIKTVEKHRKDIMLRLKIDNFTELVQYAMRIGIVD
ncbi:MAG: LuxR C-terminal-related transcriptional regulator [Pseudanabaena sp. Salubria-1]|jgi:DNA-binding NarL/FixJ family response regulator|nr:LuxR C-terminal-related transcriptional regulator [Pseudanabaena sp. Salubria-1]